MISVLEVEDYFAISGLKTNLKIDIKNSNVAGKKL